MKLSERLRPLMELRERLRTDQTIPGKWKRNLLSFNRDLIGIVRKYFEALEMLESSKKLLEKVNKGKLTMQQYNAKIRHAKQQREEAEFIFGMLLKISKILGKREEDPMATKKAILYLDSMRNVSA